MTGVSGAAVSDGGAGIDLDESRLDDVARLEALDAASMLPTIAGSGAQVREAALLASEAGLDRLADDGRPRAIVVAGVGGSGISGDVLAAVAGPGAPVPVIVHRGYGLPGWVGAADVVLGASCSGRTEETLSAVEQAVRRGCRVGGVGADDSPLAELVARGRGPYVPVSLGRMPRASLWALSVPLVLAGRALGILDISADDLEATATRLDEDAERCRATSETFVNPAKSLALELAGSLPVAWGSSPIAGVAAYRLAGQLAENGKYPCISGLLPEANHNQVVAFDGVYGALSKPDDDDIFRDRVEEPERTRLHLILLRDTEEHPKTALRADVSRELAERRGIPVTELRAEGRSPLERLAGLVALPDFTSAYLGLLYGLDPSPIGPISELKSRVVG